jgi:hypothetical protein
MTAQELYKVYAAWSGQLHFYVRKELGAHIDCEFFPSDYLFKLYGGHAEDAPLQVWNFQTVPGFQRPPGEARATVKLPRPEDNPSAADLDRVFRDLCLAAARVLAVDVSKAKLPPPEKKHAFPTKRLRNKSK